MNAEKVEWKIVMEKELGKPRLNWRVILKFDKNSVAQNTKHSKRRRLILLVILNVGESSMA
jgi:hypothetical protein